jgi:hypothetical protein
MDLPDCALAEGPLPDVALEQKEEEQGWRGVMKLSSCLCNSCFRFGVGFFRAVKVDAVGWDIA